MISSMHRTSCVRTGFLRFRESRLRERKAQNLHSLREYRVRRFCQCDSGVSVIRSRGLSAIAEGCNLSLTGEMHAGGWLTQSSHLLPPLQIYQCSTHVQPTCYSVPSCPTVKISPGSRLSFVLCFRQRYPPKSRGKHQLSHIVVCRARPSCHSADGVMFCPALPLRTLRLPSPLGKNAGHIGWAGKWPRDDGESEQKGHLRLT